jgi:hypothetical protein
MEGKVGPTSNGILGGVFPGLQPIAMTNVMRRFPIVERLVTVLYRRTKSCKYVGPKKDVESPNGFHCERCRRSRVEISGRSLREGESRLTASLLGLEGLHLLFQPLEAC